MRLKKYQLAQNSIYGIEALLINKDELEPILMPEQLRDEIPTLNKMGYMKIDLDKYTAEFIKYAADFKEPVLEIGCAYGFIVRKVLEAGVRIVASDLSHEHLISLLKQIKGEYLKNLYLYPGRFPNEISFPASSLRAVLASRVLHFINGDDIELGLDKINNWLIDGGKFYFIAMSPYHKSIDEQFLPQYEQNVRNNVRWPGEIENQWKIAPQHKDYVQPYLHVFDIPLLNQLLPKHGFRIDKIDYFTYVGDTTGGEQGHVGLIATKV